MSHVVMPLSFRTDPKILELATCLDISKHAAVGLVFSIWAWAFEYAAGREDDSGLFPLTPNVVCIATHTTNRRVFDAMITTGWIRDEGVGYSLRAFERNISRLSKRKLNKRRAALRRSNVLIGIIRRMRNRCAYCRKLFKSKDLQIDHIVPLAAGGSDDVSNLTAACGPCNASKGATLVGVAL